MISTLPAQHTTFFHLVNARYVHVFVSSSNLSSKYKKVGVLPIRIVKSKLGVGNLSVVKIYIIRPKPGPVAKNATSRPSRWESNPRPLDY